MAQNRLGGPGIPLPFPQALFPAFLSGAANTAATNVVSLGYGEALPIPGGDYIVSGAPIQWLDPVTGTWVFLSSSTTVGGLYMHSDGQNWRVINPQGVVSGAVVTTAGTAYTQALTTVTPNLGGSTYQAIVGGAVALALPGGGGGSGYILPPIVIIAAPPSPGLQAVATATMTGGAVTGYTVISGGAGYLTAPQVTILPNPYDPNYGSIVGATATVTTTGAGTITAILCTFMGTPQVAQPTLAIACPGSSGTAAATTVWLAESAVQYVYLQPL